MYQRCAHGGSCASGLRYESQMTSLHGQTALITGGGSGIGLACATHLARDGAAVRPNPQEVQSVHRISLSQITRADAVDFIDIPESPRKVVRVGIGERRIHAPTAAVLYQFRELLAGRVTRVDELEQPRFAWK